MKKVILIIGALLLCEMAYASYIFNPGTGGGPSTLTDSNGCIWQIGSTISTGGVVSVTLLSCPAASRGCTNGMPLGLLLSITCP